ncbi:hypothetical protein HY971_02780 [Candidatus Kaiserbacteria bacterium]|nr:hypothetical protein [Candidatus Kaiserbacteria bacterium]
MKSISRIVLALLLFSPVFASAQTIPLSDSLALQRQGIFDCNQNGAYAMSVGALGATGGVYVPVADATVELNTGVLVYQQCVLREVINRMREAATAGTGRKAVLAIQTGRGGNPQYVVRQAQEMLTVVDDPTMLDFLRGSGLKALDPVLQTPITRALVRNYEMRTRAPQNTLTCFYKDSLADVYSGQLPTTANIWDAVRAAGTPNCVPSLAFYSSEELAGSRIARAEQYQQDQWNWGRGYYSMTDSNGNIITPAVNVQESFQTILDSPVRQQESANDIGQMINALYAGMTTQILSDRNGLAGLTQSIGGQPRYIDQVVREASQGLRDSITNTAIQTLLSAQKVEAEYFKTVNAIGTVLTRAILGLKSAESQCWDLIIYQNDNHPERHVCSGPLSADNTCISTAGSCTVNPTTGEQTCPTGVALKVSTSTAFSQAVITANITDLGNATLARISTSKKALDLITQLIDSVTGASTDAQRLAVVQLNNMVAQKLLHIKPDLDGPNGVIKQLESVQAAMLDENSGLVATTVKLWADSEPLQPGKGWCNVNKPAVLDAWKKCWDKNNPQASACPTP